MTELEKFLAWHIWINLPGKRWMIMVRDGNILHYLGPQAKHQAALMHPAATTTRSREKSFDGQSGIQD
jgi:hypothetical protein